VDVGNPALAIDCPRCGLVTARFLQYCQNCGFGLWPSGPYASAAFVAWRDTDTSRADARRYDLEVPVDDRAPVVDYEEEAHRLGVHLSPRSVWPFTICLGFFPIFLALAPFGTIARIILGAIGLLILATGVIGWVVFEDTRMYTQGAAADHDHGEQEPGAGGANAGDGKRERS
jgi:hypothetical protein